jgi:beta-lactamase class A
MAVALFGLCSTSKVMAVTAILKKSETVMGLLKQRIRYQQSDLVSYNPITQKRSLFSLAQESLI